MSFSFSENWDAATPPALSAGWNADAAMTTSAGHSFSSPNSLTLSAGTAGTRYYATYATADLSGGSTLDVTSLFYFDSSIISGAYYVGPTFRCSAATMDNSSTSCYWVNAYFNPGLGASSVRFTKIVNGVETDLYVVYMGSTFTTGTWYSIRATCYGSNVFNVVVTRLSDGWTLSISGNFGSAAAVAISSLSAPDISSGDYYGVAMQAATTSSVFVDDQSVNSSGAAVILRPNNPVVVPIPFQYYHPD